ncbi:MAG: fatty acid kinase fatty acid binding subunit [Thermoleophilaceae bacterium]|jgi:DegV family protein with EDD domain|nr:fatty acid kinase fatty acid binding subunit [Thermoleophilaceae bacterium]
MGNVAVVADTTGYLPPALTDELGISLISLYVNFGPERTQKESDITDYNAFFEELRTTERLPTTSQPSVGDFIEVYEPLLAAGKDIVSIHLSGGISGTCEAARQAAEALERDGKGGERVHVFDSTTAAGGQGMITLVAAHAALAGDDAETVVAKTQAARDDVKIWFAIDTLEFFKLGGRIGAAGAWIGSTLKVKPILTLEHEITPVERVRTSKRAFERLVHYAEQRHEDGCDAWVVQHIHAPADAERLVERGVDIFGTEPTYVSELGAVLGTHTGPGMLGIGALPTKHFS